MAPGGNVKKFLEEIQNEHSPNKRTLNRLERSLKEISTNDHRGLTECICKFVELVIGFAAPQEHKLQVFVSRKYFGIIKDIMTEDLINVFIREITKWMFNIILDEDINTWCVKKELLKVFNWCLMDCTKTIRQEIVQQLPPMFLYKMVDHIGSYGDYELQVIIIETIFRMFGKSKINPIIKDLIPESEELSQNFAHINVDNFEEDCREVLNAINRQFDKIFSLLCTCVQVDNKILISPIEGLNGIWVDFNLWDSIISWYHHEGEIWELITIFSSDIKKVDMYEKSEKNSLFIRFKLSGGCVTSIEENQKYYNEIKSVNIIIEKSSESTKFISEVLPKMFGDKYHFPAHTTESKYKPLKLQITKSQPKFDANVSSVCLQKYGPSSILTNQSSSKNNSHSEHLFSESELDDLHRDDEPPETEKNELPESFTLRILSGRCSDSSVKYSNIIRNQNETENKMVSENYKTAESTFNNNVSQAINTYSDKWHTAEEVTQNPLTSIDTRIILSDKTNFISRQTDMGSMKVNIGEIKTLQDESLSRVPVSKAQEIAVAILETSKPNNHEKLKCNYATFEKCWVSEIETKANVENEINTETNPMIEDIPMTFEEKLILTGNVVQATPNTISPKENSENVPQSYTIFRSTHNNKITDSSEHEKNKDNGNSIIVNKNQKAITDEQSSIVEGQFVTDILQTTFDNENVLDKLDISSVDSGLSTEKGCTQKHKQTTNVNTSKGMLKLKKENKKFKVLSFESHKSKVELKLTAKQTTLNKTGNIDGHSNLDKTENKMMKNSELETNNSYSTPSQKTLDRSTAAKIIVEGSADVTIRNKKQVNMVNITETNVNLDRIPKFETDVFKKAYTVEAEERDKNLKSTNKTSTSEINKANKLIFNEDGYKISCRSEQNKLKHISKVILGNQKDSEQQRNKTITENSEFNKNHSEESSKIERVSPKYKTTRRSRKNKIGKENKSSRIESVITEHSEGPIGLDRENSTNKYKSNIEDNQLNNESNKKCRGEDEKNLNQKHKDNSRTGSLQAEEISVTSECNKSAASSGNLVSKNDVTKIELQNNGIITTISSTEELPNVKCAEIVGSENLFPTGNTGKEDLLLELKDKEIYPETNQMLNKEHILNPSSTLNKTNDLMTISAHQEPPKNKKEIVISSYENLVPKDNVEKEDLLSKFKFKEINPETNKTFSKEHEFHRSQILDSSFNKMTIMNADKGSLNIQNKEVLISTETALPKIRVRKDNLLPQKEDKKTCESMNKERKLKRKHIISETKKPKKNQTKEASLSTETLLPKTRIGKDNSKNKKTSRTVNKVKNIKLINVGEEQPNIQYVNILSSSENLLSKMNAEKVVLLPKVKSKETYLKTSTILYEEHQSSGSQMLDTSSNKISIINEVEEIQNIRNEEVLNSTETVLPKIRVRKDDLLPQKEVKKTTESVNKERKLKRKHIISETIKPLNIQNEEFLTETLLPKTHIGKDDSKYNKTIRSASKAKDIKTNHVDEEPPNIQSVEILSFSENLLSKANKEKENLLSNFKSKEIYVETNSMLNEECELNRSQTLESSLKEVIINADTGSLNIQDEKVLNSTETVLTKIHVKKDNLLPAQEYKQNNESANEEEKLKHNEVLISSNSNTITRTKKRFDKRLLLSLSEEEEDVFENDKKLVINPEKEFDMLKKTCEGITDKIRLYTDIENKKQLTIHLERIKIGADGFRYDTEKVESQELPLTQDLHSLSEVETLEICKKHQNITFEVNTSRAAKETESDKQEKIDNNHDKNDISEERTKSSNQHRQDLLENKSKIDINKAKELISKKNVEFELNNIVKSNSNSINQTKDYNHSFSTTISGRKTRKLYDPDNLTYLEEIQSISTKIMSLEKSLEVKNDVSVQPENLQDEHDSSFVTKRTIKRRQSPKYKSDIRKKIIKPDINSDKKSNLQKGTKKSTTLKKNFKQNQPVVRKNEIAYTDLIENEKKSTPNRIESSLQSDSNHYKIRRIFNQFCPENRQSILRSLNDTLNYFRRSRITERNLNFSIPGIKNEYFTKYAYPKSIKTHKTEHKKNEGSKIKILSNIKLNDWIPVHSAANKIKMQETVKNYFETDIEPKKKFEMDYEPLLRVTTPTWKATALLDGNNVVIESKDYIGKFLVLFFYPFDFGKLPYTYPPIEITLFNEYFNQFQEINTNIVGCSVDCYFTHQEYIKHLLGGSELIEKIKYPLIADTNHQMCKAFKVQMKNFGHSCRAALLIDPNGCIFGKIIMDLTIPLEIQDIFKYIKTYQSI